MPPSGEMCHTRDCRADQDRHDASARVHHRCPSLRSTIKAKKSAMRQFVKGATTAWGDAGDCKQDPDNIRQVPGAEVGFFRNMRVYEKVPKQKCRSITGKEPTNARWTDTNKQDEATPKCRSRLVSKDSQEVQTPTFTRPHHRSIPCDYSFLWLLLGTLQRGPDDAT